jgi:hypothetical protein
LGGCQMELAKEESTIFFEKDGELKGAEGGEAI